MSVLNVVQNRIYISECTSLAEIVLINTLACLAVELGNEGFLDIEPWHELISKFGGMSKLYIGKVCFLVSNLE
jgi:hypothetical protein